MVFLDVTRTSNYAHRILRSILREKRPGGVVRRRFDFVETSSKCLEYFYAGHFLNKHKNVMATKIYFQTFETSSYHAASTVKSAMWCIEKSLEANAHLFI